ncbi:MAG: DUF11 domain-containing protein, partial [Lachnospiraceae bacterium]|nr:DUF11 domain-containing protein [Lachnospiraceae bacterium]
MKKSTGILKRIGAVLMIVCLVVTSGYFSELTGLFGRQLQAKVTAKAAGEEKWVDDILYNFAKLWKYNAEGKKTEIKTAGNKEAFFRLNKTTIRVKEDYKADAAFYEDKAENYNLLTDWYKTDYEGLQAGLFVTIEGTNYIYDKDGNVASGMKNDGWNYVYFNDYEPNLAAAVASGDEYGDDKGYYEVVPETNNAAEGAKLRIQHFNNKIGGTSGGWLLPNNWFSDHAETEPSGDGLKSFHCDYKITLVDTAVQPVYNYLKVNNVYYRLKKQNDAILIAPVNIFDTSNDKEPKIDQTKFPYDALPYNFSDYSETLTVNENEYVYWDMTGTMPTGRFYTIDTQNVTLKAVQKLTHADTWDEAQGGWLDGATAADWGNINTKAFHREYTAVLHNSTDNYTVKFRDENDTTELKKVTVQCGDTPVYSGDEPVKSSANGVSYKFYGWKNKATGEVYAKDRLPATYGHTTYLAVFKEVLTITADSDEKTYNGSALTKDTFVVTGYPVDLADADKPVFTVVMTDGSTITNAGTKPNVIATVNGVAVNTENAVLIGDYFVLAANGTLTVNRKAVTITAKDNDKTYDGTALTESGFTTSALETGDTHTFTVVMTADSKIKYVGTTPNVIATVDGVAVTTGTATVVGNYLVTTANGELAIVKRIVTLTSASAEKEYDGTPLTKPNVTVGGDGFVEGEVSDIKATGSVTTVADGEVTNTITYTKGDNFNANNYTITKNEGKLTITKSTNALVIASSTKSWTYDGATHKDEVYTVTYGGTTIAADASGKVFTLPTGDTVTITATADGVKDYNADYDENNTFKYVLTNAGNYGSVTTNFGTLSIEKRIVTLTSASAQKEYDGTALTSPEVTVGGDGFVAGEVTDIKATGSVTTVADGEVTNTITYTEGAGFKASNYTITKSEGKLKIGASTKALIITSSTKSWTYDGTTHKDEVYTVTYGGTTIAADASDKVFTLPTGDILTITATAAGVKDYNTGYKENNEFTYELTNAGNYNSVSTNFGTLSIEKRSVTLTSASAEKEYDGTALTSPEVTVGGDEFVAGEVTDIKATGSVTTVGVVTNTVTFTEGADFKVENYEIIENLGTLTITASTKALEITSSTKSWTYDGKTHKDEVYTVSYGGTSVAADAETDGKVFTLPTGDKVTITATAEGVKDYNAGYKENNTFTYTLENSDCYDNITTNVGTLSIDRKAVTITAGSADKYYDETKLTCSEFTATDLEEGDTHEFTVTMTENSAITEMGTLPNVIATVDGTEVTTGEEAEIGNYLVTTEEGMLTILQGILEVEATASPSSEVKAGDTVTYTVVVTNKGNTTINGVTLSHLPIAETGSSAESFDLAPDGQKTITYAYTVTQSDVDAGEFTRTSTATGIAHKENAVEASGSATVATVAAKPELTVTKTASVNSDVKPGDTIGYTVVVTNSGNVTVTGITAQYSPIAQTGNAESFNLTPGSTKTLTYNYTVTQTDMDAGKFTRTVTVEGLDPSKKAVTASNDVEVTTAAASAKLSITKKIEADGAVTIDDTVTYTITVANTGNVSVEDGVLTDNLVDLSEKTFALQPGETATFTYDYVVTQADVDAGSIVNTVKANAKAARGDDPEEVEALTTLPTERYVLNITSADASWTYDGESHTRDEYSVTYGGVAIPADDETGKTFTLGNGDVLTITSTAAGVKDYSTEYFANNTFTYTITNDALY